MSLNLKRTAWKSLLSILQVVINKSLICLTKCNKCKRLLIQTILFLLWTVQSVNNVMLKHKPSKKLSMLVVLSSLKWTVILREEEPSLLLPPHKVPSFSLVMVSMLTIWSNLILILSSEGFSVKVILNNWWKKLKMLYHKKINKDWSNRLKRVSLR